MSVTCRAPAKINPVLRVLGRRDDGYHRLVTLMVALELAGDVTVERLPMGAGVEVVVEGPCASADIPADESNLAARAALAVRAHLGGTEALRVTLTKRVPSRAGLGGGSADAAAAALATARLYGAQASDSPGADVPPALDAALAARLAAIGSDCAFFHAARREGAAIATGSGTEVATVPTRPSWWISLVTPDVDCSTPEVYGALGLARGSTADFAGEGLLAESALERQAAAEALLGSDAERVRGALVNDLEAAARRAYPELDAWFGFAHDAGLPVTLAGSGSSLFGLHDQEFEAREAVERLTQRARRAGREPRFSAVTRAAPVGEGVR